MPGIVVLEQGRGRVLVSHADRDQAIDMLKAAFVRERLAKDEFEARVGRALEARTCAELAGVTAGIPSLLVAGQPAGTPTRIRDQRIRREMSQAELAAALGVSRRTVILIESGRYLPSLPLAFTIARFFGLTVDETFGAGRQEADAPPAGEHDALYPCARMTATG